MLSPILAFCWAQLSHQQPNYPQPSTDIIWLYTHLSNPSPSFPNPQTHPSSEIPKCTWPKRLQEMHEVTSITSLYNRPAWYFGDGRGGQRESVYHIPSLRPLRSGLYLLHHQTPLTYVLHRMFTTCVSKFSNVYFLNLIAFPHPQAELLCT